MPEILKLIYHFVVGYLMAFIGLMSPGLLTLTTLNTAIDRGTKETVKFAIGAALPIIIQAHLALLGAQYLKKHPEILTNFSKIAVFVFLGLSVLFYKQYKKRSLVIQPPKFHIKNSFLYGLFISSINPLAIPFYFTYSTLLEMQGWLSIREPYISFFVLGAVLGVISILSLYGKHAPALLSRLQFVVKHFKLILSISMFALSIISLLHALHLY